MIAQRWIYDSTGGGEYDCKGGWGYDFTGGGKIVQGVGNMIV